MELDKLKKGGVRDIRVALHSSYSDSPSQMETLFRYQEIDGLEVSLLERVPQDVIECYRVLDQEKQDIQISSLISKYAEISIEPSKDPRDSPAC